MSLLDTIKGAREEAEQAGTLIGNQKKGDSSAESSEAQPKRSYRSSAANAKPTREAAGSVRNVSEKPEMTKEEKKAAREQRRADEDVAYDAKKIMLEQVPGYKRSQKIWWGMLIAGIVLTAASWLYMRTVGNGAQVTGDMAIPSIVMMVVAYVLVIGAFIYDLVRVRPMRNQVDDQLNGMTKKRMRRVITEEERRKATEGAKK